ncbi:MAG: MBL fold metallo-hydrolase [Candidatus Aenigmarchaeota archaeon]|nr:MBL fold metallo-hydrolase [Candidatus Aenigmarchaeota archaeon]MDW8149230.1 MBL fold metallo-hydrolase [Candidatus Aenigmarchaeota archaeon]
MIEIIRKNNICIKANDKKVFLDPTISESFSFISHAHEDHLPEIIVDEPFCTQETFELIKAKNPSFKANIVKIGKKINFDDFSVEFLEAGHILGSSQIFLEFDGLSILYSGDIKTFGLTAGKYRVKNADILIMESTYGLPIYKFPSVEEIISELEKIFNNENNFSLFGYQLGKAQDIVKILNMIGIEPTVTKSVKTYCDVYKNFGIDIKFTEEKTNIIVRPTSLISKFIGDENSIVFTGWSLTRDFGIKSLPLSDHCDFYQLLDYIVEVSPKKIYVVHGFVYEFCKEIEKNLGIEAIPFSYDISNTSLYSFFSRNQ